MNMLDSDGELEVDLGPKIEIVENKLFWNPLGIKSRCEIRKCGRPAYSYCDEKITMCLNTTILFKGCGKKCCMKHIVLKIEGE